MQRWQDIITTKKKNVNHADTESTEAKQKEEKNYEKRVSRKDATTQRKGKKTDTMTES